MCSKLPSVLAERFVTGWVQSWQQALSGAQLVSPRLASPTLSKAKEPPGAPEDSGSGPLIPLHECIYALLYCLHKSWRLGTCCAETTTYPNEECNCLEFGAGFF